MRFPENRGSTYWLSSASHQVQILKQPTAVTLLRNISLQSLWHLRLCTYRCRPCCRNSWNEASHDMSLSLTSPHVLVQFYSIRVSILPMLCKKVFVGTTLTSSRKLHHPYRNSLLASISGLENTFINYVTLSSWWFTVQLKA